MIPALTRQWGEVISSLADLVRLEGRDEVRALERIAGELVEAARVATRATTASIAAHCVERLRLAPGEELVMWALITSQVVPAVGAQLEAMSGGEITCGVLAALCFRDAAAVAVHALSSTGTLARMGLIEVTDERGGQRSSWSRRTVRATERLLSIGLSAPSDAIDPTLSSLIVDRAVPPLDRLVFAPATIDAVVDAVRSGTSFVLVGGTGTGRRCLLQAVLQELFRQRCLPVDVAALATDEADLEAQLRAIVRECRLLDLVAIFANIDHASPEQITRIAAHTRELHRPALATARPHAGARPFARAVSVIETTPLSSRQRSAVWTNLLGLEHESAAFLADSFPIAPALAASAAHMARARSGGPPRADDILHGIRSVTDRSLDRYARRLALTQTWADVVLDREQTEAIRDLVSRIAMRRQVYEDWGFASKLGKGLGISALMSGPPGTGKTMVASLIAKDLGLEVYQVDPSRVVSKWIGETEKNLGALFDAAESAHAVLLFDEADGLFAKRTDVKSSNDRNANFETNYLLQRLESFTGVCFLTTNHEASMDPAFHRRFSAHLRFEVPQSAQRVLLWKAMIPSHAPIAAGVNFDDLARRYVMSGGYIRNAALRAAFSAANDGSAITMAYLERAAGLEYEAMGKIAC